MIFQLILSIALSSAYDSSQNLNFWTDHLKNNSIDVRINAIQKLAELKNAQSAETIGKLLSDSNSEIRYHALRALAKFPTNEVFEELSAHAKIEKDPYLKSETRRSLAAVKEILDKNAEKATNTPPEGE